MKRKMIVVMVMVALLLGLLPASQVSADKIGVLLQNSDGSSGGYAHSLKLSAGDWSVTEGVATVSAVGDNETLVNRLVDADHADNNATNSETRSDASVTPAALAYWSQNTLTTRLLAWLNGGTITGLNIGDGNATIDNSGNLLARTVSYIRDDENPFCQQYYAGTNYDDNYTEVCAPPSRLQ